MSHQINNKEIWKEISFDSGYPENLKVEISIFGRARRTTKQYGVTILKPTLVKGYEVTRFRIRLKRKDKDNQRIEFLRNQINILEKEINKFKAKYKDNKIKDFSFYIEEKKVQEQIKILDGLKKNFKKEFRTIERKRTINYAELTHRLVAEYFVDKPSENHYIVAHLDYDKRNNRADNLKWMTKQENIDHAKKSPYVIKARQDRLGKRFEGSKVCKLTSTKVMYIKKELEKGVSYKRLAKKFNVSEMQISRIKRGENWKDVKAAE